MTPNKNTRRDIYHLRLNKYKADLVFSGDNHNYQRTFPLKYNSEGGYSLIIPSYQITIKII
jgi:hypothetical protein